MESQDEESEDLEDHESHVIEFDTKEEKSELESVVEETEEDVDDIPQGHTEEISLEDQGLDEDIKSLIDKKEEHLRTLSKSVEGGKRFFIKGKPPISNLVSLIHVLKENDFDFTKYKGEDYDYIADWIEQVLDLEELAEKLRATEKREDYIMTILEEA